MKRLEDLTELQQEIIKSLKPARAGGLSLKDLKASLEEEDYTATIDELREGVGELIKYGAVRGENDVAGKRYFLARGVGSGYRNQRKLLGRPHIRDVYKFFSRIFGSVFLLFGFSIFINQNSTISGAVVSETFSGNAPLISSLVFVIAGVALLFLSFKKSQKKN